MGLADRFKDKIQDKDIFESSKNVDENIKFISKPLDLKNESSIINPIENVLSSIDDSSSSSLYENLETEIISKIRKTPYWEEYSIQRQEKMISSYLHAKSNINNNFVSLQNEKQFIQDVLALSNNR
jgi:hypothetical protein